VFLFFPSPTKRKGGKWQPLQQQKKETTKLPETMLYAKKKKEVT